MSYKIVISEQAEADLKSIYEYIAFELSAPVNAGNQLSRIEKRIEDLDEFPDRYRRYEHEPWKNRGLRVVPVDNYCVFYIPDAANHEVVIIRVMYAGRNTAKQLNKYTNL